MRRAVSMNFETCLLCKGWRELISIWIEKSPQVPARECEYYVGTMGDAEVDAVLLTLAHRIMFVVRLLSFVHMSLAPQARL